MTDQQKDLTQQLDALQGQMAYLVERQRQQEEFFDEMAPVFKGVMDVATQRFGTLEDKGYVAFGKELVGVMDRVVTGFSPQDVEQLGDNIVQILSTVKSVTQPRMMSLAEEASEAIEAADGAEPVGFMDLLRARNDEDVQRGLATVLLLLRQVGKHVSSVAKTRVDARSKLEQRLGPRRQLAAPAAPTPKSYGERIAPKKRRPPPTRAEEPRFTKPAVELKVEGVEFDDEGFMVDSTQWNRDVAVQIARAVGLSVLTDDHWKVIDFARADYAERSASPNVRRLGTGSGVGTKAIYTLFERAPGKNAARIAGLPKPVGCI